MSNAELPQGRKAGAPQALALILAMTLPVTPLLSLVPNLPQLFEHFANTPHRDFLVPMIITMPSICIALLSPIAGSLADWIGRRRLLLLAAALFTVCGLLPLWLDDIWKILLAQLGVGIAEAIIMTTGNTLLGDYFDAQARQRWLGVQGILGSVLATLIVLSGGALGTINWHMPFLMNSLGGIVFVWLLLATWEPARSTAHADGAAQAERFPWRPMTLIFSVTILISLLYFVQAVELGLIFSKLGAHSSALISVLSTVASIGVIAGGWWYRRQKGVTVAANVTTILTAYAIGLLGLGLARDYHVGLPFGIIAQFGNGLVVPVLVGWALRTLEFRYRGRGMGLWTTCFFCGQFLSPSVVALMARARAGDVLAAIVEIGALCAALAVGAFLVARRPAAHIANA
jgi:MFS family permease